MYEFGSLEHKAGLLNIQGAQAATIHVAMFMQVLAAQQAGNEKLAAFYVERFPPDVRKAYDAWIAQKPFENPNADPHPFVPNLYQMRGATEATEATASAAGKVEQSLKAGSLSGQYLANTVLFAAVLVTNSGRSTWFVGVLVIMVYLMFATTLYLLPPQGR